MEALRISVPESEPTPRWPEDGLCGGYEPELFYKADSKEIARAICARCVVLEQCRDYIQLHREIGGIWAGMDEDEREAAFGRLYSLPRRKY